MVRPSRRFCRMYRSAAEISRESEKKLVEEFRVTMI